MFASLLKTIRVQSMDQIIETRIHAYIAFWKKSYLSISSIENKLFIRILF
jgi:hypothetical protein